MIQATNHARRLASSTVTHHRRWLPVFIVTSLAFGGALYARASLTGVAPTDIDEPLPIASCNRLYDHNEDPRGFGPRTGARSEDPGGPSDPGSFPR